MIKVLCSGCYGRVSIANRTRKCFEVTHTELLDHWPEEFITVRASYGFIGDECCVLPLRLWNFKMKEILPKDSEAFIRISRNVQSFLAPVNESDNEADMGHSMKLLKRISGFNFR